MNEHRRSLIDGERKEEWGRKPQRPVLYSGCLGPATPLVNVTSTFTRRPSCQILDSIGSEQTLAFVVPERSTQKS